MEKRVDKLGCAFISFGSMAPKRAEKALHIPRYSYPSSSRILILRVGMQNNLP